MYVSESFTFNSQTGVNNRNTSLVTPPLLNNDNTSLVIQ